MDIRWLKTFVVAAGFENFRKASEELYLTQPAISKHIKRLEEHLQIGLFERSGKKVILTDAGHYFLPFAKKLILSYEEGMEHFESWKQGYHRKLTIAAAPQIASSFLPPLLRAFMDENDDIEVLINVVNSFEIGDEVNAGRAELGLTRVLPIQMNLNTETVHNEPVVLVGANVGGKINSIKESQVLLDYRLITNNHPDYWDTLLKDVKKHYPNVRTMAVNQIEVTKKFIENGLGVSYLPVSMVKDEIEADNLIEIKPEKIVAPDSETYVLTKVETEEARSFIAFVKESL